MTRMHRRQSSSLQTALKDYFVPIIGWLLLILLLWSFFRWEDSETSSVTSTTENRTPTSLSFGSSNTEAYIVYPNDVKEKITESSLLYKGESIIVNEGSIKLSLPDSSLVHLNKIWELKYMLDGSFELYSSDAWFDIKSDTKIALQYASVESPADSVLSLTQNEAGSTIYVLAGSAKVSNLSGVSTSLVKWQKVSISRLNAANKDLDLSTEKWIIDSYFKGSNWFIDNEWYIVLERSETPTDSPAQGTNSGSTNSQTGSIDGDYITLSNLSDEMSVNTSSLNISGVASSEKVSLISFNNRQASISSDRSFRIENLTLPLSMNDIVVKVYDDEKNILEKTVFTVYTSKPSGSSTTNTAQETASQTPITSTNQALSNAKVNPSDFWFTEPAASGTFTTTTSEITIRGYTKAKDIAGVQVNGFKLASFNGSTWRYHAFERFETLEAGTNQYKVDYLDANGKIVYSDYYTIVKKEAAAASTVTTPTSSSGWATNTNSEASDNDEWALFAE